MFFNNLVVYFMKKYKGNTCFHITSALYNFVNKTTQQKHGALFGPSPKNSWQMLVIYTYIPNNFGAQTREVIYNNSYNNLNLWN